MVFAALWDFEYSTDHMRINLTEWGHEAPVAEQSTGVIEMLWKHEECQTKKMALINPT